MNKQKQSGFALVAIAALLIAASAAASVLLLQKDRQAAWEPIKNTKSQLTEIADALQKYQRAYHRLPCPAPMNQAMDSINFGMEGLNCALGGGIAGVSRITVAGVGAVRFGTVPVRSLGLHSRFAADQWGNRITYVVIEAQTDPFQFAAITDGLRLQDAAGAALRTNGGFALISHGKDGKGATSLKGAVVGTACTASPGLDQENCDGDHQFVTGDYQTGEGGTTFDDYVVVKTVDQQALANNRPCMPPNPATPFGWGVGCTGPYVHALHGSSQSINNTRADYSGSADVTCDNGNFIVNSQTCAHTPSCPAATEIWVGAVSGCEAARGTLAHGASTNLTNTVGGRTGSVTVTCNAGVITPSGASCTGNACSLPWGGGIPHGGTTSAFSTASVSCGNTCASETRSCAFGVLSGSYTHQSCSAASCTNCTAPWGATVPHTSSITAFQASSVPCGSSCNSQTRSCSDGTLSGSFAHQSCSAAACAACPLPWGGSISHGASVTAYQSSSVPCGNTCASETRTCNNGTLSGSYGHASCTVDSCMPPGSCSLSPLLGCTALNLGSVSTGSTYPDAEARAAAMSYMRPTVGSDYEAFWFNGQSCSAMPLAYPYIAMCSNGVLSYGPYCVGC